MAAGQLTKHASYRFLLLACILNGTNCSCAMAAEPAPEVIATWRYNAVRDLPQGNEKTLVLRACIQCHDLGGLAAYKGYWKQEQWQAMVESMVKNGAVLSSTETAKVAQYLTLHFGKPELNPLQSGEAK